MSTKTLIKNGKLITPEGIRQGTLLLSDGKISALAADNAAADETIDAEGCYVAPGFIDLHTHGAGGADFMDGTVEAYITASRMHAKHGTTLLYPTTCTSSNECLFDTFETFRKASSQNLQGAQMPGLHLEGPYFTAEMAGAQDGCYLRNPELADYTDIISRADGLIKRWSFAPELPGAPQFAAELRRQGILAAAGHTAADFDQCDAAFRNGCTHLTHFFSCMSTVTRRNAHRIAGTVEYGYWQDGMTIEIIADGIHVPQPLLWLVMKIKGADRIALVTDSMRAAGMPEGTYVLGGLSSHREVIVEEGVAKMPDRSCFAGSVATADRLVRTMITLGGCTLEDAVKMITATPARIMHIDNHKGALAVGKDADVVIFDENINIQRTIINGKTIYAKC